MLIFASDGGVHDVPAWAAVEAGLGSGTVVDEACGASVVIASVVVFGVVPAESMGRGRYQP